MEGTLRESMGGIEARECRLRGCGLEAANPAPNEKRLAQGSQEPHRPHLARRRKSPMFLWGAFSEPESKAGEEGWKECILSTLPKALMREENSSTQHRGGYPDDNPGAMSGAPAMSHLTNTDLLMEGRTSRVFDRGSRQNVRSSPLLPGPQTLHDVKADQILTVKEN